MYWTYDSRVGVAYLALRDRGDVVSSITSRAVAAGSDDSADSKIVLDFDKQGKLVGIEFLRPDDQLLPAVLARILATESH